MIRAGLCVEQKVLMAIAICARSGVYNKEQITEKEYEILNRSGAPG